jgi:thiol-disulfide isomerase/thioredoxin
MGLGQGIVFTEGSWNEIVHKAQREKKPIFIDAYTVWCGPCKKLAKEVFTQASVGEYFNKNFISYRMDMEKGEGVEFAKKYDVTAFPTLLYFNDKGILMNKSVGFKEADELLNTSLNALDPKNQIGAFKKEYEESDQSLKQLIIYCNKLKEADNYKIAREIAVSRLQKLKKKEKYSYEEWVLLSNYLSDYSSPVFKKFVANKAKYLKIVDSTKINKYIHDVLSNTSLYYSARNDNGVSLEKYIQAVKELQPYINSNYYIARAQYFIHLPGPDEDALFKYASDFLDHDYVLHFDDGKMPYYLAFMANRYIDKKDERYTAAALRWATKAAMMEGNDYKGKFVLAQLSFKMGKYNESLLLAEDAYKLEKNIVEAGVIKNLFKAGTIGPFIEQVKSALKDDL